MDIIFPDWSPIEILTAFNDLLGIPTSTEFFEVSPWPVDNDLYIPMTESLATKRLLEIFN